MAAGSPSAALSAGGVFSEESGCFFGRWGLPLASQVIAAPRAAEHVVPTARRFRCVLLEPLADGTEGADGAAAAGADGAAAAAAAAAAAGADTGAVADEAGKESMCQELRGGKGVTHFFVYGSLRPDDTMGMPWTKQFQDGFDYVSRAVLPGALLFDDRFAAVTLDGGSKGQSVHGFLLGLRSRPGEAGLTPEQDCLLSEKLATADRIEGFLEGRPAENNLYQRAVRWVTPVGGPPIAAFVYHKPDCNRSHPVPSGEWLQRGGGGGQDTPHQKLNGPS